jgi:hypothetical protein
VHCDTHLQDIRGYLRHEINPAAVITGKPGKLLIINLSSILSMLHTTVDATGDRPASSFYNNFHTR